MKIKCINNDYYKFSLKKNKIYDARQGQKGFFSLVDETGERYVYPPKLFEVVDEDNKKND